MPDERQYSSNEMSQKLQGKKNHQQLSDFNHKKGVKFQPIKYFHNFSLTVLAI